jgi:hypothetical protein
MCDRGKAGLAFAIAGAELEAEADRRPRRGSPALGSRLGPRLWSRRVASGQTRAVRAIGAVVCRAAGAVTRRAASGLLQCNWFAIVDRETMIRKLIFGYQYGPVFGLRLAKGEAGQHVFRKFS